MSPRPASFVIECEEGWRRILCDLVDELEATGHPFTISQIKEKEGLLHFACDFESPPSQEIKYMFERTIYQYRFLSGRICERCGRPGTLRPGLWVRTLCLSCLEARLIEGSSL